MLTGKSVRKWILGLSCAVVPLTGCANGPMPNKGLFSWFNRAPLTEREKQRRDQEEATGKLKDPANLHLRYAQWRENVGDLSDARKSYKYALQENPKSLEAKLGLARLDQLAGRTAEAEQGFQNALKSRPHDAMAQNALGQFYASQKQWSKALALLEEAADGAPGELTYRHHFAVALAQSGDVQGAFQHFKQVSGEAEAHYNIGYLMLEEGQKDMARQRFEQALALNPNLTQAQTMLDEIDGKSKTTQVAEAPKPPIAFPRNAIQQTAAQQFPTRPDVPAQQFPSRPNVPAQQFPTRQNVPAQPAPPVRFQVAEEPARPPVNWRTATHAVVQPAPVNTPPVSNPPVQAVQTAPRSAMPSAPMTTPQQAPVSAMPSASAPMTTTQPAPTEPPAPPAWRKHKVVDETPQAAPDYLPPHQAESKPATKPPQINPASTPLITPAQREQWENQMRAMNQ